MAWFKNKKEKANPETENIPSLPSLPPLPKLPELPSSSMQFKPNALPRFPTSSLGNKFSNDTIKDAVSGEKESEEANESEEIQMMPEVPEGPLTKEVSSMSELPEERKFRPSYPTKSEGGPIFVRLDKFEENLEIFNKIKRQLTGVEKILDEIKRTKEQEDKELSEWEAKLQTMKEQIDKIDKDIFSNVE